MLGPLLAMPSGQGLNMTILAILKVNRANWLLVLEIKLELRKNVSTIDKISLLAGQHYTCKLSIIWILVLDCVNASVVPIGWDEQMPRIAEKEGGVRQLVWMDSPRWSHFDIPWRAGLVDFEKLTGHRWWSVMTSGDRCWMFWIILATARGQLSGNMCALYCAGSSKILTCEYLCSSQLQIKKMPMKWKSAEHVFSFHMLDVLLVNSEFSPSHLQVHYQSAPERRLWKLLLKRNAWPFGFALPSTNARTWAAGITIMYYPIARRALPGGAWRGLEGPGGAWRVVAFACWRHLL